jgi:hypothetical protein
MNSPSPYLEEPAIPEGMTIQEYRINRPKVKVSTVRWLIGFVVVR